MPIAATAMVAANKVVAILLVQSVSHVELPDQGQALFVAKLVRTGQKDVTPTYQGELPRSPPLSGCSSCFVRTSRVNVRTIAC